MKREGRQHGMVRTFIILPSPFNPRPNTRVLNRLDSLPTAGLFTKVPTRPTNHSKFTSKCSRVRCSGSHLHPVCKSKDKTKGNNKSKSFDCRLGLNLSGISASGLLGHLADYNYDDDDRDVELRSNCVYNAYNVDGDSINGEIMPAADDNEDEGTNHSGQEGSDMDFSDLGFVLDYIEEDDWCLVGDW